MTDDHGRYRFVTIKPGSYPWGNHCNAGRPAHIHISLFGRAFTQRLVTQMYFPGDPMFDHDPIFNSVREPEDRARMISEFDWEATTPEWALGFRFDILLRGREMTPFQEPRAGAARRPTGRCRRPPRRRSGRSSASGWNGTTGRSRSRRGPRARSGSPG